MTITALNSAATGLTALSLKLDVIANNLANVNTVGFKRSRANFEDLLYEARRQPGVENSIGDTSPSGIFVGSGVQLSSTQLMLDQGSLNQTGNELDLAVDGPGFFRVRVFESLSGDSIGYTRAGNFFKNANGEIVLGNRNGFRLEPSITVPEDAEEITVSSDGKVYAKVPGSAEATELGQITLARFINPEGLQAVGQNVYVETAASGPAIEGNPTEEGFGSIGQGELEMANVEPVHELIDLIETQRSFELNSQSIQAADDMLRVVANLRNA